MGEELTKMEVELLNGKILNIETKDEFNTFVQNMRDARELTLLTDAKTGVVICGPAIATFRKKN